MQQPMHRRPFYARNILTYNIYTSKNRRSSVSTDSPAMYDHALDSFVFRPDHLTQFLVPPQLTATMPQELLAEMHNWACASAALCTSLDRISALDQDAMLFAYPSDDHSFMADLLVADHSHSTVDAGALTSTSRPPSPGPYSPGSAVFQLPIFPPPNHARAGMISPPMTPTLSDGSSTPLTTIDSGVKRSPSLSDLTHINHQLTPHTVSLASSPSILIPTQPLGPVFNPASWESYLARFQAELDAAHASLCALKGHAHKLAILHDEHLRHADGDTSRPIPDDYAAWWQQLAPGVAVLELRVVGLELPDKDYVRVEWDLARQQRAGVLSAPRMVFSRE